MRRSRGSYHSKWTDDELFAIVRRYRQHAEAHQMKATFWGYEMYQRAQADAPSGTMLRQRMGQAWFDELGRDLDRITGLGARCLKPQRKLSVATSTLKIVADLRH